MKLSPLLLAGLAAAQTPAPYTDAKSGITFNAVQDTATGYLFGLALPTETTGTDFIATIGGKGTGWSGVSLGGAMVNKLLVVAWPNSQAVVSSFRKATSKMASPPVTTGTFTQTPIANGTWVNSTNWAYTFLCSKCIQTDGTTFKASDATATLGWALNTAAPAQKTNASAGVSKHSAQGTYSIDLSKARSASFNTWKTWAAGASAQLSAVPFDA